MTEEIRRCQERNGGLWAFPIPEKYLFSLREGKPFWAPLYVCHKVMMGLLDMVKYLNNRTALQILEGCTEWFCGFLKNTPPETLERMMNTEENRGHHGVLGGIYGMTGDERHLTLMRGLERRQLFEAMLVTKRTC